MEPSLKIAKYFIKLANTEGVSISPMKLIKLVYIAHGWNLAINDCALIDESPEAWRYGPVIPSVYAEYKSFKNNNITPDGSKEISFHEELELFLDKIWDVYGKYSAVQLSSMTHKVGTPWHITWNSVVDAEYMSLQIPNKLIQEHYKGKLEANRAKA